jgi:hypothetical protein
MRSRSSAVRDAARFVAAALRRRKGLVALLAGAVLAGAVPLLALWPRAYLVEARVLARPDPVLLALSNPEVTVPTEDPVRLAAEAVRKRINLEQIVREAHLAESWASSRAPLLRAKDLAMRAVAGPPSPKDRDDALVDMLEQRLYVLPEGAAVVIGIDWPDGAAARAIVAGAVNAFLEERRTREISSVEESVAILERYRDEAERRMAADQYDRLSGRLTDARIELDGARTRFDRRYVITQPAYLPRRPARPDVAAVLGAALLAGLLLGAVGAVAADAYADPRRPAEWLPGAGLGAVLAMLTLATVLAVVAGDGRIGVAVAPVLIAAALYGLWAAPARASALVLLFLALSLESPGDASGQWRSPLYPLGALMLANLNITIPIRALRFTGLDVTIALLLVVIVLRRAVRAAVDRSDVPAARPMNWAVAAWLGTVLALWAYGLARGGDFRNSLWQVHQFLMLPIAYFVFRSALRGPRDYRALARVFVAAACVKACLALWVRLAVSANPDVLPTATSHGDSVLFAGAAAIVVALLVEEAAPGRRAIAGVVLALLTAGMVANNRRLAWVELGAALVAVYAVASLTRTKRMVRRAITLSLPVLILYGVVGWTSSARVFRPVAIARSLVATRADWSTSMRDIENFNLTWTLRAHPLLGSGFGHEYVEKVKAVDISSIFAQYRYVPHNSVLGLLAFGGVIGLSGVFLTLVVGVYLAARAHRFAGSPGPRAAGLAVISAVVVYLIQCYGDMGFMSWTGVFTIAPALVVAGQLASATGAWPSAAKAE